ncbi:hypothetical protein HAX54_002306 [Datura stramonium]|uniref:Uncharacterized protein n=1 Tax=Datura stramonium TaxID=4076 RepID=A0ABS8T3P4_DATST|nr:hypothetical protein [Datura stramonium]
MVQGWHSDENYPKESRSISQVDDSRGPVRSAHINSQQMEQLQKDVAPCFTSSQYAEMSNAGGTTQWQFNACCKFNSCKIIKLLTEFADPSLSQRQVQDNQNTTQTVDKSVVQSITLMIQPSVSQPQVSHLAG